jgi:hypothetical protein
MSDSGWYILRVWVENTPGSFIVACYLYYEIITIEKNEQYSLSICFSVLSFFFYCLSVQQQSCKSKFAFLPPFKDIALDNLNSY